MTSVFASPGSGFEKALSEFGNSDEVVGLAAAVVRDGEVSFMQTYGVREIGGVDKITPETTFRIASLSKAFAATVAVQLEHEKKLALSDLAISSNSAFKLKSQAQAKSATLEHVLSHRLSLPPYAYDNLLEAGAAPKKILSEMKKVQPICSVGSCYAYQNVGFNMIAPAIEMADKQSYAASVRKRVFAPLKMDGASFGKAKLVSNGNWAQSYKRRRGAPWKAVSVKQPYYDVPAAGGVNANIVDMSKWLAAQMGHSPQVLSNTVLKRLQAPQTKTARELRRVRSMRHVSEAHYGLGWRIYKYAGATVVNHSGSVEGYGAQIAFLPEKGVGLVLLTNSNTKTFWRILPKFLDQELGLSLPAI
jgi:beta-lactamase class C